jgi:hypothetical protein
MVQLKVQRCRVHDMARTQAQQLAVSASAQLQLQLQLQQHSGLPSLAQTHMRTVHSLFISHSLTHSSLTQSLSTPPTQFFAAAAKKALTAGDKEQAMRFIKLKLLRVKKSEEAEKQLDNLNGLVSAARPALPPPPSSALLSPAHELTPVPPPPLPTPPPLHRSPPWRQRRPMQSRWQP